MTDSYTLIPDLLEKARVPENGILSQTLQSDERTKVILFGFAPGQELSAHTAPFPATLMFLKGEADKMPRDLPIRFQAFDPKIKIHGKAQFASEAETKANPRSRSAVMRVAEKLR